ncbi:hypothetical protein GCM10010353_17180 [Streptomyces chryseus]|nr:hypothetical protein GCM10010353_17180 [Streptomyces chryseus]
MQPDRHGAFAELRRVTVLAYGVGVSFADVAAERARVVQLPRGMARGDELLRVGDGVGDRVGE